VADPSAEPGSRGKVAEPTDERTPDSPRGKVAEPTDRRTPPDSPRGKAPESTDRKAPDDKDIERPGEQTGRHAVQPDRRPPTGPPRDTSRGPTRDRTDSPRRPTQQRPTQQRPTQQRPPAGPEAPRGRPTPTDGRTPPTGFDPTQYLRPQEPPRSVQNEVTQFLHLPKVWPTNGRLDERLDERVDDRIDDRLDERHGGRIDERLEGRLDQPTWQAEPTRQAAPPRQAEPRQDTRAPKRLDLDEPTPAGRKKLLITVIALVSVIAVAAGVVYLVPGLSAKLGLTDGESAIAIDPPAPPVDFSPGLQAPGTDAPAPTKAGVEAALAGPTSAGELGTLTGVVYDPMSKETLWENNPTTPLVPASTGKLLTSAAALLSLDHTSQLTTRVVQGEQPGEIVIVGGGDPTISSLKPGTESVYPGAAHLSDLVDQVKKSGVDVQSVRIDQSRYEGDSLAPGWSNADIGAGYIAPMVPAMLDGGRTDAREQDGPRTDNPARQLAEEFATRLGATVPGEATADAPKDGKVLGEIRSAPLVELVDNLLHTSDNVLAEAVAREVAKGAGEEVSFAGASKATLDILRENGFELEGVNMADGSGLSTEDNVPARLFGDILGIAAAPDGKDPRTAKLRPLVGGLPVAGGSGTLDKRFDNAGAGGRGWVRAKTGTLSGVNSLAGVVLDADNRLLVFALMTNGAGDTGAVRDALDVVAATLRGCGCR
jgi:D-alanyl-D-alanine carboxypeptidase/D-alanyl-D-alanine-endopeptidase (penicillin-binding protein 4)